MSYSLQQNMTTETKYLYQLDSLRSFAMLWIFLNHCTFLKTSPNMDCIFETYFHYGGVGVEFFIILSGFFAAYTYKETKWGGYIKHKFLRLFPVYFVCSILYLPLAIHEIGVKNVFLPFVATISFTQTVVPNLWNQINAASWTVGTLFICYLFVPIIVKKISALRKFTLYSLIFALLIAYFTLCFKYYDENIWLFYLSPYIRITDFTIGLCIGVIFKKYIGNVKLAHATFWEWGTILFLIYSLYFFHNFTHEGYFYIFQIIFLILVFSFGQGFLSRILSNMHLRTIGKYAFCFYLLHYVVVRYSDNIIDYYRLSDELLLIMVLLLDLFITSIGAFSLKKYVENRFYIKNRSYR